MSAPQVFVGKAISIAVASHDALGNQLAAESRMLKITLGDESTILPVDVVRSLLEGAIAKVPA